MFCADAILKIDTTRREIRILFTGDPLVGVVKKWPSAERS
jgi:hypothetical protein